MRLKSFRIIFQNAIGLGSEQKLLWIPAPLLAPHRADGGSKALPEIKIPLLPLSLSVSYWRGGEKERGSDRSAGKWSLAGEGGNGERLKIRNMLVTSLLLFPLPPLRLRTQFHRGKVPFLKASENVPNRSKTSAAV